MHEGHECINIHLCCSCSQRHTAPVFYCWSVKHKQWSIVTVSDQLALNFWIPWPAEIICSTPQTVLQLQPVRCPAPSFNHKRSSGVILFRCLLHLKGAQLKMFCILRRSFYVNGGGTTLFNLIYPLQSVEPSLSAKTFLFTYCNISAFNTHYRPACALYLNRIRFKLLPSSVKQSQSPVITSKQLQQTEVLSVEIAFVTSARVAKFVFARYLSNIADKHT